ncbi:2-isopropylmalate synthase [Candidatus Endobugula sertula]|uniref:2-isopropylmalate synthase n=1 Tax=Candidatus Endobugula sertula TaxID=62101 RepID=A0A1D2QRI6_9GAMM|nr:2-isopropylmalate synthase [Candidatus Endobugula sertula]
MNPFDHRYFNYRKYRPFPTINKPDRRWPSQVIEKAPIWCAVDLRDGNQALIEPMNVAQKQRLWKLLIKLGFKEIEIGFPSASQPDFDFCRWLIEEHQIPDDVRIQALTQARPELIERTYEALCDVKQAIVHVYNSTSPVQRKKVFKLDKAGVMDIARQGAQKVLDESKKYPDTDWYFEYSPESFSSTEIDYAIDVCNAVIDVWQPTPDHKAIFNLPATVECATPNVFADQIETFCDNINSRDAIVVSLHTHNDRGCAVAAAELGVMAGADRIEGTLMGNGERTGNMDIVTMAMNLYSQGVDPELDLSNADEIVRVVAECTQIAAHPRHPWFGELVYTAFSGSHQDAIKKCLSVQEDNMMWDVAYLPIDPRDLGRDYQSVIRVNSQSGKGGVAYVLEQKYGLQLPRWLQIEASRKVQAYAEQNSVEVSHQEMWRIVEETFMNTGKDYQLNTYHLEKEGETESLQATLISSDPKMADITLTGQGDGALSAFCHAIRQSTGLDVEIIHYDQHAIGAGTDASAVGYVQLKINGRRYCGIAKNKDILSANLNAILACINQVGVDSRASTSLSV